jgi:hypothetical protein
MNAAGFSECTPGGGVKPAELELPTSTLSTLPISFRAGRHSRVTNGGTAANPCFEARLGRGFDAAWSGGPSDLPGTAYPRTRPIAVLNDYLHRPRRTRHALPQRVPLPPKQEVDQAVSRKADLTAKFIPNTEEDHPSAWIVSELPTTRPESSASSAMGCVGYNLRARMALAVLVGYAIVKHLLGAIMGQDSFIPVATNARSRSDLVERGFSRQPLRVDVDIARSLEALSHAAWSVPKDKYYDGGDRYRSLNRVRAEIVEGGVKVWLSEESTPYVQLKKYNTTICGQPREYAPLPPAIAGSIGVRKMIAHHLHYLPLSTVGTKYLVNVHLIRFTAAPGRPCDTSPPGLHKDGEKYIATHLVGRCGAQGGEVVITDNDKQEMDRFTMRESGECYVFDDDRIWHMLTPVAVLEGNQYAYRDTLAFDMLPEGWEPVK